MHVGLATLFGALVGLALGLTGGGGSLLAVPMLVYGLGIPAREAFGISLAVVGATALLGVVPRLRAGTLDLKTGLIFALAGMIGAPLGTWLAVYIPEQILLLMFAILMLVIAWRMWAPRERVAEEVSPGNHSSESSTRWFFTLIVAGTVTGIMSGMFGVGGGFIIVPALIFAAGMDIHRAVSTSLLIITLVSVSGVSAHFFAGRGISVDITLLFILGGAAGMWVGTTLAASLSAARMQKVFAAGILAVAVFVIGKSIL